MTGIRTTARRSVASSVAPTSTAESKVDPVADPMGHSEQQPAELQVAIPVG
jgi:hypothetical protein